jgi:hypothetical protein
MTYPPASPGYPASPPPGGYPTYPAPAPARNRIPLYLTGAVFALGLAAYFSSFGPLLTINANIGPFGGGEFTASGLSYWTVAGLVSALLAGVSLLPRVRGYTPIVAMTAVLAVLLVIAQVVNRPPGFSIGWALWLVLLFTTLQAAAALTALLVEGGALRAPAAQPRYGQYPAHTSPVAGYYPAGQAGYPAGYGAYPTPAGGYGPADSGPPTPPTGFPSRQSPTADEPGRHRETAESPAPTSQP